MADQRKSSFTGGSMGMILGGIILAVIVVAVFTFDGFMPDESDTTGAIGAVQSECPPIYVFTSAPSKDGLGFRVALAGDVNNDGYGDFIVGARSTHSTGGVYVFSGRNGDTLYFFTGEARNDNFGNSVASAGDVNNDGYADLIMGAWGNDAGGSNTGRAYVFSGLNGDTLAVFTGEAEGDCFGWSVASAGDVNNDGYADVIVSAPLNSAGGSETGRVYVFSGLNGDTLSVFTGEATADHFGWSVASADDVNNDGFADLIVGAPGKTNVGIGGRAYVFSGQNGETLHIFTGEARNDNFGNSVASAGDVNNDGYADLIVGANCNVAGGYRAGRAYVFSGLNGDTLHVFTGEATFDHFGFSVASAGDVNSDGFSDLIVGAYSKVVGGDRTGRVYVFSGQNGETLHIFTGGARSESFGLGVASVGDVNNDGYADLIVGSNFIVAGGYYASRAYVFSGAPCSDFFKISQLSYQPSQKTDEY